jgi:hypothetical protein
MSLTNLMEFKKEDLKVLREMWSRGERLRDLVDQ